MKKFDFSLKALLSYREHLEQIAKQELAEVLAEINRVNDYIEELLTDGEKAREDLQLRSESGITAPEINRYMDFLAGVEQRVHEARDYLAKLNQLEDKKRKALAKKTVGKKVIANLKDRQKKEYRYEMEKFQQQQSDEMVLLSGPGLQGGGDFVNRDKE